MRKKKCRSPFDRTAEDMKGERVGGTTRSKGLQAGAEPGPAEEQTSTHGHPLHHLSCLGARMLFFFTDFNSKAFKHVLVETPNTSKNLKMSIIWDL